MGALGARAAGGGAGEDTDSKLESPALHAQEDQGKTAGEYGLPVSCAGLRVSCMSYRPGLGVGRVHSLLNIQPRGK